MDGHEHMRRFNKKLGWCWLAVAGGWLFIGGYTLLNGADLWTAGWSFAIAAGSYWLAGGHLRSAD